MRFMFLSLCMAILIFCTDTVHAGFFSSDVVTITPPNIFVKYDEDIPLIAPSNMQNIRFAAKNGINKAILDNVTVEVTDIIAQASVDDYTVSINGYGKSKYNYSIFPLVMVLKITNNTDHIVTLERTIVKIEDDKQNDYPVVNSISAAKQKAIVDINSAYDEWIQNYKQKNMTINKDHFYGAKYKADYDRFVREIKEALAKGNEIRWPDTAPGKKQVPQVSFEHDWSPDNMYKRRITGSFVKHMADLSNIMNRLKADAVTKINKMPDTANGVITSGIYQPINILPGRSGKVLIPFSKRKQDEVIKNISIGVYDLPTKVNEAGLPTKRANFNFEMEATYEK